MTKIELVRTVAKKTGIDQPTVLAALEGTIDTIMDSLVQKENVYLRGWGTWTLKHRAQNLRHFRAVVFQAQHSHISCFPLFVFWYLRCILNGDIVPRPHY